MYDVQTLQFNPLCKNLRNRKSTQPSENALFNQYFRRNPG
ncbi:hypothetical protein YSA_02362 [Pseudomonas putida ND6]|uniref:Uncharacterized protein n=1 Tax=Pseudomonas putida ND6 TaxID=231023 RepID=I3URC6_PSEPU|nr:hypothetical protein YSA_02362 [Pseudomonas putida ND6]